MKERSLPLSRASSGRRHNRWQEGQAIEISRGALTGLAGYLVRRTGGSRWIVQVDGLAPGVVVAIAAIALTERGTELAATGAPPAATRQRRQAKRTLVRKEN